MNGDGIGGERSFIITKVLVDTNILVYAYDSANPVKQKRAIEILEQLASSHAGALSVQVLAEFVVAVTRKIADPLDFATVSDRPAGGRKCEGKTAGGVVFTQQHPRQPVRLTGVFDWGQFWGKAGAAAILLPLAVVFSGQFFLSGTLLHRRYSLLQHPETLPDLFYSDRRKSGRFPLLNEFQVGQQPGLCRRLFFFFIRGLPGREGLFPSGVCQMVRAADRAGGVVGAAQQVVRTDLKKVGHLAEQLQVGLPLANLIKGKGAAADVQFFRQFLLGKLMLVAQSGEPFGEQGNPSPEMAILGELQSHAIIYNHPENFSSENAIYRVKMLWTVLFQYLLKCYNM